MLSFVPSASVLQRAAQWVQLNDARVGIPRTQQPCTVWGAFYREMPGELVRDRPMPAGFCMGERVSTFVLSSNIVISRCVVDHSIKDTCRHHHVHMSACRSVKICSQGSSMYMATELTESSRLLAIT